MAHPHNLTRVKARGKSVLPAVEVQEEKVEEVQPAEEAQTEVKEGTTDVS